MAVTKIIAVKSTLSRALNYIQDVDKTEGKLLVSSFACSYETADIEFEHTLSKSVMRKGNNLAHHLIQSFEPGETDADTAHEIGKRLADAATAGKYEYVLTTHIDKGHIHNHIMFCATSFVDHHKYVSNRKTYAAIRRSSDELCREYGLSVIAPGENSKGKHYSEYAADKTGGGSWKSKLKVAIDLTIPRAKDFEDFLRLMQAQGYEIKRGKYVSLKAPGQERFIRCKTLGADYTEEAISGRIFGNYSRSPRIDRNKTAITLIQQIEDSITKQQQLKNPYWTKINNLKEAAKTVNFLTENKLLYVPDFEAKYQKINAAFEETEAALKAAKHRLTDMAVLIKHVSVYRQTKPAADGLKTAQNKDTYRREHERELALHQAAAKALKVARPAGGHLPSLALMKADFARQSAHKDALCSDYDSLKQLARQYGIIKQNIESILCSARVKDKTKKRSAER